MRYLRCVSQNHTNSRRLKVKTQLYIYIYKTSNQLHVSASKRPSSGCKSTEKGCILYSPQPFPLDLQPDDGLLEAETRSWLAVLYIYKKLLTNYMFRPLTGHHQVVNLMKRVEGCTIYNLTSV